MAAVLFRLLHAGAYLGLGGMFGWSLNRERTSAATPAPPVEPNPRPEAPLFDSKRAEALLTQLYGLTTDVAHGVGEHSSRVAAVGRELTTLSGAGDGGKIAPVIQAVASLLQANARLEEKLAYASEKMQQQAKEIEVQLADAMTDPLTGIPNRRAFNQELARRIPEFKRMGTPVSLIMIDVDYFKKLNDTHGHHAGDEVLRGVAASLRGTVRDMDLPVRFGGEEFAVILPTAHLDVAKQVAERVRQAIESARFQVGSAELRVTASVGVAEIAATDDEATLVQRADAALYAAKKAGRNNGHYHDGAHSLPISTVDLSRDSWKPDQSARRHAATSDHQRSMANELTQSGQNGLSEREGFEQALKRRLSQTQTAERTLSILLVEIDDFHGSLDAAAAEVSAASVLQSVRQVVTGRETIAVLEPGKVGVLLSGKDCSASVETADIVNARFNAACRARDRAGRLPTLSFGVAETRGQQPGSAILARAEEALAASKSGGGNRIHFHTANTRQPMLADLNVATTKR